MRTSLARINQSAGLKLTLNHDFKDASQIMPIANVGVVNMISFNRFHSTMLAEVGRFEVRQPEGICYPAGQPFLHRIFGYRGIILFPWLARVHDIDVRKQYPDDNGVQSHATPNRKLYANKITANSQVNSKVDSSKARNSFKSVRSTAETAGLGNGNNHLTRLHPYYQVLIDARDCPFVSSRIQTEVAGSVGTACLLGQPSGKDKPSVVSSIKGLDYVAHEDILPYTSHEERPIQHELHSRLFQYNSDAIPIGGSKYRPTDRLKSWHMRHHWLEMSQVYRETTENIRVTVIPFYLGHSTMQDIYTYWWRYCIRLENFSDAKVQLRERHWRIFSQTNMLQTIKGRGVVGVEPLLTKSEPAYQYSSHVNLQDKSGHMWGTFTMQRADGHTFECRIPAFSLESSLDGTSKPLSSKHKSSLSDKNDEHGQGQGQGHDDDHDHDHDHKD